jgi:hypothetical protein
MNETPDTTRSRRSVLGAAAAGVVGLLAGRLGRPDTAAATVGTLQYGADNDAGTDQTTLRSAADSWTLMGYNSGTGTGLYGQSEGFGVFGFTNGGVAVYGDAYVNGTAVKAWAVSTQGTALEVVGKAKFSRSGKTYLLAGHSYKDVSIAGVTSASYALATLQTNRAGVYVQSVVPTTGKIRISLNKKVTAKTYVAHFVIN